MQSVVRKITNPENILSYTLGFVVAWFGLNEVLVPQEWATFAPSFLGSGTLVIGVVVLHGVILTSCALLLFFNTYRRVAAAVLALIFVEVIIGLVMQTGLSDIAVRDIGLCGMAIGLALLASSPRAAAE